MSNTTARPLTSAEKASLRESRKRTKRHAAIKERVEARKRSIPAAVKFAPIPGFPNYSAGSNGVIYPHRTWTPLVPFTLPTGYDKVILTNGCMGHGYVHRWVALAFLGPPPFEGAQVNHLNGIKTDNRLENLEWVSQSENMLHAIRTGLLKNQGEDSKLSKLTDDQVREIRRIWEADQRPQRRLAKDFGVTVMTINRLLRKESWKHL